MSLTNEVKQRILDLWLSGRTSGAIAEELGVTRNSVMGFVHRMKQKGALSDNRKTKKKIEKSVKAEAPAPAVVLPAVIKQESNVVAYSKQRFKSIEPDTGLHAYFEKPKKGVTMMELGMRSCRFIISAENDPAPIYCGDEIDRSSYCKKRADICFYSSGSANKSGGEDTKAA